VAEWLKFSPLALKVLGSRRLVYGILRKLSRFTPQGMKIRCSGEGEGSEEEEWLRGNLDLYPFIKGSVMYTGSLTFPPITSTAMTITAIDSVLHYRSQRMLSPKYM